MYLTIRCGKVEYKIYDKYEVFPENISCLSQETYGKREITLITCTTSSKKRIIIKAREEEFYEEK
ncbi:MAG: sortase [Clostridia bacterium]|nr:sortase [Clostridia bacterium]